MSIVSSSPAAKLLHPYIPTSPRPCSPRPDTLTPLRPSVCGSPPAEHPRRVTWVELFFDLVFVAAVAQVGTPLGDDYTLGGLGRYAFLLAVIWWAWNGYAMYATRFDGDDRVQRSLTLVQMVAVIFMAANAEGALDSVSSAGFAAAYALMRLILVLQYIRALAIPEARALAAESAIGIGVAATLWLVSSLTPVPQRYGIWAAALSIDVGTAAMTSRHVRSLPPHAEHLPERFGLFTLILLGESIVAIMRGIQSQADWTMPAAASALLGIGLIFGLWWWYFDGASAAAHRPIRERADVVRLAIWNYAHLPVYLGLALSAVGIEHIVRTGAKRHLHAEEAWILCAAAAAATASLVLLTSVSPHREADGAGRRLSAALALCAVPLALPLAASVVEPVVFVAVLAVTCVVQVSILPQQLVDDDASGGGDVE
jgi:low temperature requirement protein LtrA